MMYNYKCIDCGREFDTPAKVKEDRGEYWGFPAYEEMNVCPFCGGDYEEIEENEDECDGD